VCGIAGIVNFGDRRPPPSVAVLRRMRDSLSHRGPDDAAIYADAHAGLVHTRLSIIDLSTGGQPLCNEDDSLWIVFNGEIFNYVELRKDLETTGHSFRTHSDTEVALHAYEQYGCDCFTKFNGQWAIAIWNARTGSLVLSRDRVGVRPLYIHSSPGCVRFASEVKAILADNEVPRALSTEGLHQVFMFWTTVAPVTPFEGIEELRPGTVRTYDRDGRAREQKYWTPSFTQNSTESMLTMREAVGQLKERLTAATVLRITRADVPVGSYLSGGLDSSVIAYLGLEAHPAEYRTYSLRFADAEFDESRYQRLMANHIRSVHREITVSRSDIARVFPEVIRHTEKPVLRAAPAPMYLLSQLVREDGTKAVLTGEGADELLGGYDLFRESEIRRFWGRAPESKVRPLLFRRIYPYLARSPQGAEAFALTFWRQGIDNPQNPWFSHEPRWRTTMQLQRLLHVDRRATDAGTQWVSSALGVDVDQLPADTLARAQYLEIVTLLSGYLLSSQGDRMLMAHSVEGRFPFLDADVMEYAMSLPASLKLVGLREKAVLKTLAKEILPPEIVNRQKQPYRAPDAISFLLDPPPYVEEMLSQEAIEEAGVFDTAAASMLVKKCRKVVSERGAEALLGNSDNMGLVGVLSTQLLHHHFIRRGGLFPESLHTRQERIIQR
jgi:asparagine synthase (glutamine-hydrolysing)